MIVVGGLIEKDHKYLLVQEGIDDRGHWGMPVGILEINESIKEGAKREIKEETNLDVELTGIVNIANRVTKDDTIMGVIFTTKIKKGKVKVDGEEILDAKWFTYEEIIKMKPNMRNFDWLNKCITAYQKGQIASLDLLTKM